MYNSTGFSPPPPPPFDSSPPPHSSAPPPPPPNSTYLHPSRDREIEHASANFLELLKRIYQLTIEYFWPGYHESLRQALIEKRHKLTDNQRIKLQGVVQENLSKALSNTIAIANTRWNKKFQKQLTDEIENYLKHPSMSEEEKEAERKRIDLELQGNLLKTYYKQLIEQTPSLKKEESKQKTESKEKSKPQNSEQKVESKEPQKKDPLSPKKQDISNEIEKKKRSPEQQANVSIPVKDEALDPNTTAPYNQLKACSSGETATVAGATAAVLNATHANEQRVLFLKQEGNTIQVKETESQVASSQLPPRKGINNIEITCDEKATDMITEDPTQGYFHTRFMNETITLLQYLVKGYNTTTRPSSSTAWSAARLPNNASVVAPTSGSSYYAFYTTSANTFAPTGPNLYTFSSGQPTPQRVFSFTDGSFSIFQDWGQVNKFAARLFDSFRTLSGTISIDLNQTISGTLKSLPIGPKTPLPNNGKPILLLAPIDKGGEETTVLLEYLPSQQEVLSARELPPNSGLSNGKMSIAICPDMPDIFVYAREETQATGTNQTEYAIRFNVFNASNGTSSLTGDQVYSTGSSLSPQPEALCFPNGKGSVVYLKDGHPFLLSFDFLNLNAPSPAAAGPAPTTSPAPSTNISVQISLPINLGDIPILITPAIIAISNNTETIKVINLNGYEIRKPDGSLVNAGEIFSRDEFYNLTISRGNATQNSVPELEGCDKQGNCQPSTADGHKTLFTGSGNSNLLAIILSTIAAVIAAVGGGAIAYNQCTDKVFPYRKRAKVALDKKEEPYQKW